MTDTPSCSAPMRALVENLERQATNLGDYVSARQQLFTAIAALEAERDALRQRLAEAEHAMRIARTHHMRLRQAEEAVALLDTLRRLAEDLANDFATASDDADELASVVAASIKHQQTGR